MLLADGQASWTGCPSVTGIDVVGRGFFAPPPSKRVLPVPGNPAVFVLCVPTHTHKR